LLKWGRADAPHLTVKGLVNTPLNGGVKMANVFVGPPPRECTDGLVARSRDRVWYRVGGWAGEGMMQPLVWVEGALCMFNTNEVVEVVYDIGLWKTARGAYD
jgi:hypothetical protein